MWLKVNHIEGRAMTGDLLAFDRSEPMSDVKNAQSLNSESEGKDIRRMKNAVLGYASRLLSVFGSGESGVQTEELVPAHPGPPTILVVDDSPVARKLVDLALCHRGYNLIFASTGREAIEVFREHRPILILMNWTLPDLSGEELCREIRSISEGFHTYIIVLTAR